jgi:hypothetical protein
MTKEDEKHMLEDLGRNPEELVKQQTEAEKGLQGRQQAYNAAAPGNTLTEMATGAALSGSEGAYELTMTVLKDWSMSGRLTKVVEPENTWETGPQHGELPTV